MSYLFGDSTASKLEVNYIEFLRDAVEFSVQVLLAEQRIAEGQTQTRTLELETVAELDKLQELPPLVAKALEDVIKDSGDSATARCAFAISASAFDAVRAESASLRSALESAIEKRDSKATQEREGCVKALERLLQHHDLPDTTEEISLVLVGARYTGQSRLKTASGLEAVLELDVPADHLFERAVRVDRLTERLDVHVPEMGGWLHKELKQRALHLDKHTVTELTIGPSGGKLKLRSGAEGTGPGFDLVFSKQAPHVQMERVEPKDVSERSFQVEEADVRNLLAFYEKLSVAAKELKGRRRRLLEAKLDGEQLSNHTKPGVLVQRLITDIAPVVQMIASRSQAADELVLRRQLGEARREEIFVSKSDLKLKLEPLSANNRALFDPLWVTLPHPPSSPPIAPSEDDEVPAILVDSVELIPA